MILYRSEGIEATCPKCHGGNAMLNNSSMSGWDEKEERFIQSYKCRDCGSTVKNPEMIEVPYSELITRYRNGIDSQK